MDIRAEVYTPLQNMAVWLAGWLYGAESFDDLDDALTALGGVHSLTAKEIPLETVPPSESGVLALCRTIRQHSGSFITTAAPGEPALRLILSGPGEPPALPAGSAAAEAVAHSWAGGIVFATPNPFRHLVAVPEPAMARSDDCALVGATIWHLFTLDGKLPAPAHLSPGDADHLLAKATAKAADLIDAKGGITHTLRSPRLIVGALNDFYELPGLPSTLAPRAGKLFARADRVAAIIETVTTRTGSHEFDEELFGLWRHIRAARTAAVTCAVSEYARGPHF